MRERQDRYPALAGSALLHGALLAAALVTLSKPPKPITLGEAVPVSIVTSAPPSRAALKAAEEAEASAPEPAPAAETPAPPAPTPTQAPPLLRPPPPRPALPKPEPPKPPTPAPAKPPPPAPRPAPAPKPAPAPAKPPPRMTVKPKPELNLDALASSLPKSRARPQELDLGAIASGPKSSRQDLDLAAIASGGGPRGPARAATAHVARPAGAASAGLSPGETAALKAKLNRLWNINCAIPGASSVVVKMRMKLSPTGGLAGPPALVSVSGEASEAVKDAAVTRAASAIARGAPFLEISPEHLKTLTDYFVVNFDGKPSCGVG